MGQDSEGKRPEDRGAGDPESLRVVREGSTGLGTMGAAGKYAGVGLQFALSILLFLYVGQWADRRVGTDGIFTILGVFLGAGAAFYSIYRSLMADQRRDEAAAAQRKADAERARKAR